MNKLTKENLNKCVAEMSKEDNGILSTKSYYYHSSKISKTEIIEKAWENDIILSFDETDHPIIKVYKKLLLTSDI